MRVSTADVSRRMAAGGRRVDNGVQPGPGSFAHLAVLAETLVRCHMSGTEQFIPVQAAFGWRAVTVARTRPIESPPRVITTARHRMSTPKALAALVATTLACALIGFFPTVAKG